MNKGKDGLLLKVSSEELMKKKIHPQIKIYRLLMVTEIYKLKLKIVSCLLKQRIAFSNKIILFPYRLVLLGQFNYNTT